MNHISHIVHLRKHNALKKKEKNLYQAFENLFNLKAKTMADLILSVFSEKLLLRKKALTVNEQLKYCQIEHNDKSKPAIKIEILIEPYRGKNKYVIQMMRF